MKFKYSYLIKQKLIRAYRCNGEHVLCEDVEMRLACLLIEVESMVFLIYNNDPSYEQSSLVLCTEDSL